MSNTNTGGPAFPHSRLGSDHNGMTLRDYFAAKAMQAHISHEVTEVINEIGVAMWSYEMADAMLKAREA